MDSRRIGGIVLTIVVVVGLGIYRRGDDSKKIRSEATRMLQTMACYKAREAVIDDMADSAHEEAFSAAYTDGDRRRGAKFDEDVYLKIFFQSMIRQARGRGLGPVAEELQQLNGVANRYAAGQTEKDESSKVPADTPGAVARAAEAAPPQVNESETPALGDEKNDAPSAETPESPAYKLSTAEFTDTADDAISELLFTRISAHVDAQKGHELEAIRELPAGCRMIYCTRMLENQFEAGGFTQFFEKGSGKLTPETLESLRLLGAKAHVTVFKQAIAAFVRKKTEQMQFEMSSSIKAICEKYKKGSLKSAAEKWSDLSENTDDLRVKYIRAHADEFSQ